MTESTPQILPELARALRAHWALFLAVLAASLLGALLFVVAQPTRYTADAAASSQDPSLEFRRLGRAVDVPDDAGLIAAANAETIVGPEALARVRSAIDSSAPVGALAERVEAEVDPNSLLTIVEAEAPTPEEAAELANAVAAEGVELVNARARASFASQARELRRQLDAAPDDRAAARQAADLSDLRTLAATAAPATVVREAIEPSAPSAPRVARDIALGALLGVILALTAVLLRDSFVPDRGRRN